MFSLIFIDHLWQFPSPTDTRIPLGSLLCRLRLLLSTSSTWRRCVSENRGTPKSSILIRFFIINHPFWGMPIFGNIMKNPCVGYMLYIDNIYIYMSLYVRNTYTHRIIYTLTGTYNDHQIYSRTFVSCKCEAGHS